MNKTNLLESLSKVEELAGTSKVKRFLNNPYKYAKAILHREFIYPKKKNEVSDVSQTFFGKKMHLLLPASTDIYLTGGKSHDSEIRLAKYLIRSVKPGSTFWDIGAHYGYFSSLASRLASDTGTILAFEPSPTSFKILDKNAQEDNNLHVHNMAVGMESGMLTFYEFSNLYSEYNSFNIDQYKKEKWFDKNRPKEIKIETITLDQIMDRFESKQFPEFIKIDVEGAEFEVLSGGKKILKNNDSTILMEYLSKQRGNESHRKTEALLKELGFGAFIISSDGGLEKVVDVAKSLEDRGLDSDNVVFKKS